MIVTHIFSIIWSTINNNNLLEPTYIYTAFIYIVTFVLIWLCRRTILPSSQNAIKIINEMISTQHYNLIHIWIWKWSQLFFTLSCSSFHSFLISVFSVSFDWAIMVVSEMSQAHFDQKVSILDRARACAGRLIMDYIFLAWYRSNLSKS